MIDEGLKKRAEFFLKKVTTVHIKTKSAFYNGLIIEVYHDHIIIDDRFFGELPLFFIEIERVEPFKKAGKDEKI